MLELDLLTAVTADIGPRRELWLNIFLSMR